MSFDYVRKTYGVPAKRGGTVKFGRPGGEERNGVITRATHYVHVRFEGDRHSVPVHPTDTWLTYVEPAAARPQRAS